MLASGWPSGTAEAFGVRGTQVQAGEEVQRLADFLNEGDKIASLAKIAREDTEAEPEAPPEVTPPEPPAPESAETPNE